MGAELARLTLAHEAEYRRRWPDALPMCDDCAFRKGTTPNRSAATVMDALKAVVEGDAFYCHKGVGDDDAPRRLCGGWAMATFVPKPRDPRLVAAACSALAKGGLPL